MTDRTPRPSIKAAAMVDAYAAVMPDAPVGRLGTWRLKEGADANAFINGWREVAEWALATQPVAACPILLRDEDDPGTFVGWWPFGTIAEWERFRDSPELKARLAPFGVMLDHIGDAVFRLVAVPAPPFDRTT